MILWDTQNDTLRNAQNADVGTKSIKSIKSIKILTPGPIGSTRRVLNQAFYLLSILIPIFDKNRWYLRVDPKHIFLPTLDGQA